MRGQYLGYRDVPGVHPGSTVETYVAVRLFIESWRWEGVPIYIRTGKNLPVTATEVSVQFRRPPRETFGELVPGGSAHMRFRLSPDMAIGMGLRVKQPGERMVGNDMELMLTAQPPRSGRLTSGCSATRCAATATCSGARISSMRNGASCEPMLDNATPLYTYNPGSWGPDEATQLIGADGDPGATRK